MIRMSQDKSHDTTKIRLFLIEYINVHHCLREIYCIKKSSMITKLTEMSFASFSHLGYPKSDPITISINRRACDLMTCNSICFIANTEIQALYPITNTNTFKTSPNIILTSTFILSTMTKSKFLRTLSSFITVAHALPQSKALFAYTEWQYFQIQLIWNADNTYHICGQLQGTGRHTLKYWLKPSYNEPLNLHQSHWRLIHTIEKCIYLIYHLNPLRDH